MNEATQVKNDKILLASIRVDITEATSKLSSVYKEEEAVSKRVVQTEDKLKEVQLLCIAEIEKMKAQEASLRKTERDADNAVKRSKEELKVLKTQKKESMKDLKRQNEWVFTAEELKKKLNRGNATLKVVERKKLAYISDIELFKVKKDVAEEEYKDILLKAKLVTDESDAKVHLNTEKVKSLKAEASVLTKDNKTSQSKLEHTTSERLRIEKDLEVYIGRVEKHYKKAFPELKMKL